MNPTAADRTVTTKIGDLHVEIRGEGPAIFCWPTLYCDARTLDPLVEDLARDHQVVVVDGPGHGRSGRSPGVFSMRDCADAAMEILDTLGLRRVTWIGAAWGGHVGVAAALHHRSRLAGLVLVNAPMTAWRGPRLALMRLTYALLWLLGPRSFMATMIADTMIGRTAGPDRKAIVGAVSSALRRCDRRGLLLAARSAMLQRPDLVPVLGRVAVPTVFVTGAEDALFPVEEARAQARGIPDCQFVVVEHSAHQSALEAPADVLSVVRARLPAWEPG